MLRNSACQSIHGLNQYTVLARLEKHAPVPHQRRAHLSRRHTPRFGTSACADSAASRVIDSTCLRPPSYAYGLDRGVRAGL